MSNDALDRIRQKKRPAVPSRNATTESSISQNSSATNNQDTDTASSQVSEDSINQSTEISNTQSNKASRSLDTKTSRHQESKILKTKASTLRLEQSIATDLTTLCKQQGISREVLIEAMFLYCQNHPDVLELVLEQAKARHLQRQEISNRKRADTMMKRFGDDT